MSDAPLPPDAPASPPPPAPPPPAPRKGRGCLFGGLGILGGIALAFFGLIAIVIVIAVASNSGGEGDVATVPLPADLPPDGGEEGSSTSPAVACNQAAPSDALDTARVGLFPGRPDAQPANDHEAAIGDCVRIAGQTGWLLDVEQVTNAIGDELLRLEVRVQNRDADAHPYNPLDWRLQTPNGQVVDAWGLDTSATAPLSAGDLIGGGEVQGTVSIELPAGAPAGTYYVIWKPEAFNSGRGIWAVDI